MDEFIDIKNIPSLIVESLKKRFEFDKVNLENNVATWEVSYDKTVEREKRVGWYAYVSLKSNMDYGAAIDVTLKHFTESGFSKEKITENITKEVKRYLECQKAL
jgi:hypothetical protein